MGISIWQLLIILAIVLLLFGTRRLRNLGGDLGGAIKGFKKALTDKNENEATNNLAEQSDVVEKSQPSEKENV